MVAAEMTGMVAVRRGMPGEESGDVHGRDDGSKQHVLGDDGEPVHGVWPLTDEPVIVQRGCGVKAGRPAGPNGIHTSIQATPHDGSNAQGSTFPDCHITRGG
jgi:hypothetical protein